MWNPSKTWITLRSSLWFVPAILVTAAVGLAIGLVEVDFRIGHTLSRQWPRWFGASPEGARAILQAISTSTVTVTGIIFSIVIVALSVASNQYTPRILRNFMRDRGTQLVLGVLVAVFAYSLIVLRTVRSGDTPFVPVLAVGTAIILALISIGFLVYFIHHIASAIQAPTMIAGITKETIGSIRELFPVTAPAGTPDEPDDPPETEWATVCSNETGYLQNAGRELLRLAERHDAIVRVERKMGEFILTNTPLASVFPASRLNKQLERCILKCFVIDSFRTIEQDPSYGIRQLVDIALKALSPGVNDTSTAINCIDYLGAILHAVVEREPMPARVICHGRVRLIYRRPLTVERLVDEALLQIRQSSAGNPAVQMRLLKVIASTADAIRHDSYKVVLVRHVRLVEEQALRTIGGQRDQEIIRSRAREVAHRLR